MDDKMLFIMRSFDIRKLSRACNTHGCSKPPSKEVNVFEFDARTTRKRELVTLYLCTEHHSGLSSFLEQLKGLCERGRIIQKEDFDIGRVTH